MQLSLLPQSMTLHKGEVFLPLMNAILPTLMPPKHPQPFSIVFNPNFQKRIGLHFGPHGQVVEGLHTLHCLPATKGRLHRVLFVPRDAIQPAKPQGHKLEVFDENRKKVWWINMADHGRSRQYIAQRDSLYMLPN